MKMKKSHLSIRATLLVIIGVLNVLVAAFVGAGVYRSWQSFDDAQALKRGSVAINELYTVNKHLSIERGAALSILSASPDTAEILHADFADSRAAADVALELALSMINVKNVPAAAELIQQVKSRRETLQGLRKEMDGALNLPIEKRDPMISDRFFKASTALITEVQNLILTYSSAFQNIDAAISQQMRFKYFVWELAEYAGEEYAIIGKLIVEDKYPTPEQQEQLLSLRGRIQYGWEIIRKFSYGSPFAEKLVPYMEEAETHYFLTFDQIRELFYGFRPISTGAGYPISIEIWLGMASQAVDSLLELQDEVLHETQLHVDTMERNVRKEIGFTLLAFLCALTLSLYCWRVLVTRVTSPVNAMVNALYRATEGEEFEPPRIAYSNDEIGKLARVLEVFQDNARRMKQSNEELERYAYITAHDLKSPLRAIDNLSQWIEEDVSDKLSEKGRAYMETLRARVRRMEKLLNDTLEYSRLGAKPGRPVSSEVLGGKELIEDTVGLMAVPPGFTVKIGEGFSGLKLHRIPLQQVFYNLINNAIKHHDKRTGLIEVDAGREADHYVFTVRDDGPGIPPQFHNKAFEMFQTLKPRDQKEGSGMGLAFVKKILTTYGGSITLESEEGKGALFRFTWPRPERGEKE